MAKVEASALVPASLAECWDFYFDQRFWPAWVDGFGSVAYIKDYPHQTGRVSWRSNASGRGTVNEIVLAHEPRRLHRISFEDPATEGELETIFGLERSATRVSCTMTYSLLGKGPFDRLAGLLFVKGQFRNSLQRSLDAFRREAAERFAVTAYDPYTVGSK